MVVGGIGMGMVFVPLFDIVMAGVRPQEMGSASGVLQTVNALGMSLGIAGLGAIFFALAGGHGRHGPVYLGAAEWTALATVGLLACSFAVAFGLPGGPGKWASRPITDNPRDDGPLVRRPRRGSAHARRVTTRTVKVRGGRAPRGSSGPRGTIQRPVVREQAMDRFGDRLGQRGPREPGP